MAGLLGAAFAHPVFGYTSHSLRRFTAVTAHTLPLGRELRRRYCQAVETMSRRSEDELVTDVLTHWFGAPTVPRFDPLKQQMKLWYATSKEVDDDIRNRFGEDIELAMEGGWDGLIGGSAHPITGELALVIILDQYTRNIFRGTGKAFAGDQKCLEVVQTILAPDKWAATQDKLSPTQIMSFLLPLMHQEAVEHLDLCDEKITELITICNDVGDEGAEAAERLEESLKYCKRHRDIIAKFGRYPHRNAALGRESTEEELAYLKDGPRFGQ